MKGAHRILDGIPIGDIAEAAGEGGNTSWQTMAVVGEWKGHWMGSFSISKAQIQQMADSIKGSEIDVVVDYEHATLYSDKAPASGWIKEAQVDADQNGNPTLLTQIVWTDTAAAHIRAKEYKYLSPVIRWNTRDRQTGRDVGVSIQSAALTNVPFLHELPEVRLNKVLAAFDNTQPEEPMNKEQFETLCKALGMDPATSTPEQALAALGERIATQGDAQTQLAALNAALGVDAGADPVAAANALRAQATAHDPTGMAALATRLSAMEATSAAMTAAAAVQAAQAQGKVAGAETPNFKHALEWATKDLAGFTAYLATIPAFSVAPGHVAPGVSIQGGQLGVLGDGDPELQAQVAKNNRILGIVPVSTAEGEQPSDDPSDHLCRLWGATDASPFRAGRE